MSHFFSFILPLVVESSVYIFVIYGFAGISTLFITKKYNANILTDVIYSGLILYLVFFVIMRWIQLPTDALVALLIAILIVGYALLFQYISKNWKFVKPLIIFTIIILLIYISLYIIPIFLGPVDPKHYSMDMAWAMNSDWVKMHFNVLKGAIEPLAFLWMPYARAATSALGWLNNLVGVSINLGTVQRHILLYSLFTFVQFWRINPNRFQKQTISKLFEIIPFLLILPGAYYLESLTLAGQLNAALGIFLLVSIVAEIIYLNHINWKWIDFWRLCALTFILFVSYTELILMLPLFVIISFFWFENIEIKFFLKMLATLSLGILPIFILKFDIFLNYLLGQGKAAVGYWPLGNDFHPNLFNIASNLIGNISYELYGFIFLFIFLVLLIVLNIYFLKKIVNSDSSYRVSIVIKFILLWLFVIYFVTLVSTAIARSPNQNYMLFKISSWTSPLFAISLFILWLNLKRSKILKFSKILVLIMISCIALFSGFNSAKFLTRFFNSVPQPQARFISHFQTIELDAMDSVPLYDLDWVENLAPWEHTFLISSLFSGFSQIENYDKDHLAWLTQKTGAITIVVPKGEKVLFYSLIGNWQAQDAKTTIILDGKTVFSSSISINPVPFLSPILEEGDHQFLINYNGSLHVPDTGDGRSLGLMFKSFHILFTQ